MDAIADTFIAFIADENNLLGLAVLALAAFFEYVFPPFPGDTVTLFGAVLIMSHDWSFWGVFGAVMAGSGSGSMAAFYVGSKWRKRRLKVRKRRLRGDRYAAEGEHDATVERSASLDRLVGKFHRHGPAYLAFNRFLPGIRSLFFIAAGLAEMRARWVLFYSLLSAGLWNLGLIALGSLLGANFDTLLGWVRRYTLVVWLIVGALLLFWLGRLVWRRIS